MRSAPAVQVVVSRGGAWRAVQAGLVALTAAILATWLAGVGPAGVHLSPWVAPIAALGAGALTWRLVSGPPERIVWDGSVWQFAPAAGVTLAGEVAVMLDFGGWMLVRFRAESGRPVVWRALSHEASAGDWHGLRAALYAARPAPAVRR